MITRRQGDLPDTPIVETDRLVLRGYRFNDFEVFYAIRRDVDVVRHITGAPLSEEESWTKFLRMIGHWSLLGFGYWAIEEKASGQMIGDVGFAEFRRSLEPPLHGVPDMGWLLAGGSQGKGYATEAARGALAWAQGNLQCDRISCVVDVHNTPSLAVADKLGFCKTTGTTYHGSDVIVLERSLRPR